MMSVRVRTALFTAGSLAVLPAALDAQWARVHEQTYLPAAHNWTFRAEYAAADRLFNAFDYGHAILYEVLLAQPAAAVDRLERREFEFLAGTLLVKPPRLPLEEAAIMPTYARLVPEAKMMFECAHILHRQVYDVLADESLDESAKDAEIARLLRYYRSRPDLAFSGLPKSMELMEGQYYATVFRTQFPKFNGLIWAYHWLQVGLYEPLVIGRTREERQAGVTAALARFRQMLEDAPAHMPHLMPMTAVVAPEFTRRFPEVAIIFDNLHSMHDVVSDILASADVPRARKRQEILGAAARYRDGDSFLMTVDEWLAMSSAMGVENMGGAAVGFLAPLPRPTVARGAVMAGVHQAHAAAAPVDPHAGRVAAPGGAGEALADLLVRVLSDSTMRARIVADTVLLRRVHELAGQVPEAHRAHIEALLPERRTP
jgi:hypothetical protein